jgi:hypothetical protein
MFGKSFVGRFARLGHQPCRAKRFMFVAGGTRVSVDAMRNPDEIAGLA